MYAKTAIASLLLSAAAYAAIPTQFSAHYLPVGINPNSRALAADTSGNLYTVSTVTTSSGAARNRAVKVDPQGAVLASFDFGSTAGDTPSAIAVDANGNVVIVGTTSSQDFPLVSPLISNTTSQAAFVVKLNPSLTRVLFSTRLGGTVSLSNQVGTTARAVAVDAAGNVYVTGSTSTIDFPITAGAFESKPPTSGLAPGAIYSYISELSADGSRLISSTYYGADTASCDGGANCAASAAFTVATAIALDTFGNIVVTGLTTASGLPVTSGVFGPTCHCSFSTDVGFLVKIRPDLSRLVWATYVPLTANARVFSSLEIAALALDGFGNVIVGGYATQGLPVSPGALQSTPSDRSNGFLLKIDPLAQTVLFSTYFGTQAPPNPVSNFGAASFSTIGVNGIAVDPQGDIFVTGVAGISGLPIAKTVPALGPDYIATISPDGLTVIDAFTAPDGAAGKAIVVTSNGAVAALGVSGSLLVSTTTPVSLLGVTNSAAPHVAPLVVPYEIISIYGLGFGPSNTLSGQPVNLTFPTSLGGVQVLFDGTPAPLLSASATQINAVVPGNVSAKTATTLTIVKDGATLATSVIPVVPAAPQVFRDTAYYARALNQDGTVNSLNNPARVNSIVSIFASGAGQFQTAMPDGSVSLLNPLLYSAVVVAQPNAIPLQVLYAGSAVGAILGADQINFRVPGITGVPFVIQLEVNGVLSDPASIYVLP